jgi:hypothetical protein
MRYSLWIAGSYACEAPSQDDALSEATRLAEFWRTEVVVQDEVLDKLAGVVRPQPVQT